MALSKDEVVEFLSSMPVIELAEMIKTLEEKWGVSAAAPAAIAVAAGAGAGAAPVEEKTEFDVILANAGANKINVIKAHGQRIFCYCLCEAGITEDTCSSQVLLFVGTA